MSNFNYPKAIEPCAPGSSRTIFDGPGQHVTCDPAKIKLLSDRVLIKDIPQDDSHSGSLIVPEVAQRGGVGKQGMLRIGVVVATGPGDAFSEHGLDAQGAVRRRLLTATCPKCATLGFWSTCPACDGAGSVPIVIPPQCQPGDTVLYDRFRSQEMIINGERYQLSNAEQTVLAVLEKS